MHFLLIIVFLAYSTLLWLVTSQKDSFLIPILISLLCSATSSKFTYYDNDLSELSIESSKEAIFYSNLYGRLFNVYYMTLWSQSSTPMIRILVTDS